MRCCAGDGGLLALRRRPAGETSSHTALRWLTTLVVSGWGKGARDASGGDQEDVPESARAALEAGDEA